MATRPPSPGSRRHLKALVLLLAVPVLVFWRPGFFYIIDDWTALIQMAQHPFGTIPGEP